MSSNDFVSSDDDNGVSSILPSSPKIKTRACSHPAASSSATKRRTGQPTASSAVSRTIRSSQRPLPGTHTAGAAGAGAATQPENGMDSHVVRPAQEPNYITAEELETVCRTMNSALLVERLVQTYKNAETFLRIRELETSKLTAIHTRLCDNLHQCTDPGSFILGFIQDLATYFDSHRRTKDLTPKFQRYLAQAACLAYKMFLSTPPDEYKIPKLGTMNDELIPFFGNEPKLVSFEDNVVDNHSGLSTMKAVQEISSDDEGDNSNNHADDDDDLVEEVRNINLDVSPEVTERYRLSRAHQEACIELLEKISASILVYYAMTVFQLEPLIRHGGDFKRDGVKLCRLLLRDKHYNEAIACIRKLDLFDAFPVETMAAEMLAVGQGSILPTYVRDREPLQRCLLDYINRQLRYTFAGNIGIVPPEYLQDVQEDLKNMPPLPRLKERRFQKEITGCCTKILQQLDEEAITYYFIWLSQRYACLRWIIMERAAQQTDEKDFSITSSSNYNGLIDLITGDDPALARLAIKEFVDIGDPVAPLYFAGRFQQQQFFVLYYNRPLDDRAVGLLKDEQLSKPKPIRSKHALNHPLDHYYTLPSHVQPLMVDNHQDLMFMKVTLSKSQLCGLDTEWVPQFARQDKAKTALIQIATDSGHVFLVDIATFLQPTQTQLLQDLDLILRLFFESPQMIKLAYDFGGDLMLLAQCMPTAKLWEPTCLVDFRRLGTANDAPIAGGLSGVVLHFLGVPLNKKQQLSNWEQRPLTLDQTTYAASDAYCLLQVYDALISAQHPFVEQLPSVPLTVYTNETTSSSSSTPSPSTGQTKYVIRHHEADLVQF